MVIKNTFWHLVSYKGVASESSNMSSADCHHLSHKTMHKATQTSTLKHKLLSISSNKYRYLTYTSFIFTYCEHLAPRQSKCMKKWFHLQCETLYSLSTCQSKTFHMVQQLMDKSSYTNMCYASDQNEVDLLIKRRLFCFRIDYRCQLSPWPLFHWLVIHITACLNLFWHFKMLLLTSLTDVVSLMMKKLRLPKYFSIRPPET